MTALTNLDIVAMVIITDQLVSRIFFKKRFNYRRKASNYVKSPGVARLQLDDLKGYVDEVINREYDMYNPLSAKISDKILGPMRYVVAIKVAGQQSSGLLLGDILVTTKKAVGVFGFKTIDILM